MPSSNSLSSATREWKTNMEEEEEEEEVAWA